MLHAVAGLFSIYHQMAFSMILDLSPKRNQQKTNQNVSLGMVMAILAAMLGIGISYLAIHTHDECLEKFNRASMIFLLISTVQIFYIAVVLDDSRPQTSTDSVNFNLKTFFRDMREIFNREIGERILFMTLSGLASEGPNNSMTIYIATVSLSD